MSRDFLFKSKHPLRSQSARGGVSDRERSNPGERGTSVVRFEPDEQGTSVVRFVPDERGSAIAEFVLIATPLFLPALLFFTAIQGTLSQEMNVSYLARQSVRAFVTADDLQVGHQRVKFILDRYSALESESSGRNNKSYGFTYNITCSAEKCLTPGSLVEIKLFREFKVQSWDGIVPSAATDTSDTGYGIVRSERKAVAVARSYVDKWRSES